MDRERYFFLINQQPKINEPSEPWPWFLSHDRLSATAPTWRWIRYRDRCRHELAEKPPDPYRVWLRALVEHAEAVLEWRKTVAPEERFWYPDPAKIPEKPTKTVRTPRFPDIATEKTVLAACLRSPEARQTKSVGP